MITLQKAAIKLAGIVSGLVLGFAALNTQAIPFQVDITVDNSYALFYGTETQATTFVGSDNNWQTTESYNFDLPSNNYIYVVTQSDLAVAQGFLAQFTNLDTNERFYSQDSQWQVTATGHYGYAPYDATLASFNELNSQLALANGGSNPSSGWVNTTAGDSNGASPWGFRPNIDSDAQWVWYNSNNASNPTLGGFNHDEYLIFRISVAASEVNVPESSSLVLMLIGLAGLVLIRRKKAV